MPQTRTAPFLRTHLLFGTIPFLSTAPLPSISFPFLSTLSSFLGTCSPSHSYPDTLPPFLGTCSFFSALRPSAPPLPFGTIRPNMTKQRASVQSCLIKRRAFVWPCLVERRVMAEQRSFVIFDLFIWTNRTKHRPSIQSYLAERDAGAGEDRCRKVNEGHRKRASDRKREREGRGWCRRGERGWYQREDV